MHEEIKKRTGIAVANCLSCSRLGTESDGEYESSYFWHVCGKLKTRSNLKSFPFKTEQECWEPCFWVSKFADNLDWTDEQLIKMQDEFLVAISIKKEN